MIASFLCFVLITLLVLFATQFIIIPYYKYKRYTKRFPGYFYPLIGVVSFLRQSFKQYGDCWGYYKDLAKKQPDVRAHILNLGNRIIIQLLDPKLIKEFFANQHLYTKVPFAATFQALVGTGLIRAEGEMWKHHRKLLSNMFHFEFLRQNIPLMVNTTREFLDKLGNGSLVNLEIMDEIQKITGEIVGRIFFGENLNRYTMNGQLLTLYLADLLADIFKNQRDPFMTVLRVLGLSLSISPKFRVLMQRVKDLRKMCFDIINDRKKSNIKAHDMLGLMLETQNSPNKEEAFSDEDIVNEFITFFSAGMDTTGHTIAMALYLLHINPQYRKNFEQETKNIYDRVDPVTSELLNEMEFTHAFLKETLRLYSPAPGTFSRIALKDHKLLDIEVSEGMAVRPNPLYNCASSKYFEEPEKFKPERWLNKSMSVDPFVYIPFSAGSRNCIGQHLSIIESKIILAEFLKRFDFQVDKSYNLKMAMRFLYEPADKLIMTLTKK